MSAWADGAWAVGAWAGTAWAEGAATGDDTHDGVDDTEVRKHVREKVREDEKAFRSKRERLREVLKQAWDGPGAVAAEVQDVARPYVDILESGALRIDYAGLEAKRAAVMGEILAFEDSLRAEFDARMAAHEDDEESVMLLALWN